MVTFFFSYVSFWVWDFSLYFFRFGIFFLCFVWVWEVLACFFRFAAVFGVVFAFTLDISFGFRW